MNSIDKADWFILLDSPKCLTNNPQEYRASINESIAVHCHVDAHPSVVAFNWFYNYTPAIHYRHHGKGLQSVLHFTPRDRWDYGPLTCVSRNPVGVAKEACQFQVLPFSMFHANWFNSYFQFLPRLPWPNTSLFLDGIRFENDPEMLVRLWWWPAHGLSFDCDHFKWYRAHLEKYKWFHFAAGQSSQCLYVQRYWSDIESGLHVQRDHCQC